MSTTHPGRLHEREHVKYMLIMRSTDEANERFAELDFAEVTNAVAKFNDELIRSSVLLAAEGLDPDPSQGVVVDFTGETPVVTDGPYGETKELSVVLPARRVVAQGRRRGGQARPTHRRHEDRNPPRNHDRRIPPGQRVDPASTRSQEPTGQL